MTTTKDNTVPAEELAMAQGRIDLLQNEIDGLRHDLEVLNNSLNTMADSKGWCGEHEEVLVALNRNLTHFQLVGRVRDYEVEFTVTARYDARATVRATNVEEAKALFLEQNSMRELLTRGDDQDAYPTIEVDITGVERD